MVQQYHVSQLHCNSKSIAGSVGPTVWLGKLIGRFAGFIRRQDENRDFGAFFKMFIDWFNNTMCPSCIVIRNPLQGRSVGPTVGSENSSGDLPVLIGGRTRIEFLGLFSKC